MNWIKHPTELIGQKVKLIPLELEHFDELYLLANDKDIWAINPFDTDGGNIENLRKDLSNSIDKRATDEYYPFVIYHLESNKIIGATRYWQIKSEHKNLEIGGTWMHSDYWGTSLNTECKYLLLTHCFEILKTVRVQIKANEDNIRSRKAIEKIGFKFEGIFRKDKIFADGTARTSAYYSIIDNEWPEAKVRLEKLLNKTERCASR